LIEGDLRIEIVERLEGGGVGEVKLLVERQADDASEGEFVLCQLVGCRDEALLLVLVIDLRAEDVEPGIGPGVMAGDGLVERDFGSCEFGVDGVDAGLIRDAEKIRVADGEDDKVAGVFRRELSGAEAVLGCNVVLESRNVDQILSEIGAEVDYLEGADDGPD
jgi:hypothetical protein